MKNILILILLIASASCTKKQYESRILGQTPSAESESVLKAASKDGSSDTEEIIVINAATDNSGDSEDISEDVDSGIVDPNADPDSRNRKKKK